MQIIVKNNTLLYDGLNLNVHLEKKDLHQKKLGDKKLQR